MSREMSSFESTRRAALLLGAPGVVDPALPRIIDVAADPPPQFERSGDSKGVDTFLSPKMPGRFSPSEIRRRPDDWRQARFLQAYLATMGNCSLARYFAAWSPGEYRAQLEKYPNFAQAQIDANEEIADRAKLILYSDLGLIEQVDVPIETRKTASSVLARLIEGLYARKDQLPLDGHRTPQKPRVARFRE